MEKLLHFSFKTVENFSNLTPSPPGKESWAPGQWERANPWGSHGGGMVRIGIDWYMTYTNMRKNICAASLTLIWSSPLPRVGRNRNFGRLQIRFVAPHESINLFHICSTWGPQAEQRSGSNCFSYRVRNLSASSDARYNTWNVPLLSGYFRFTIIITKNDLILNSTPENRL